MKSPHVYDKRTVKLEDMMKKDYIPFMAGRPKRKNVISGDDLINLSIALHTAKSMDEFLAIA